MPSAALSKKVRVVGLALLVAIYGAVFVAPRVYRSIFEPNPYAPSPTPSREEFEAIRALAEGGDPESQLFMGVFCANGNRVRQDYAQAASWYQKAAEKNNARAIRNLAVLNECGLGVERDYQKAFDLYFRAASLDDAAAHLGVAGYRFTRREGIMPFSMGYYLAWKSKAFYLVDLQFDDPVIETSFWNQYRARSRYSQDDVLVVKEVRRQASADPESRLRMAQFYFQGQGVERNFRTAGKWVREAVEGDELRAKFILGWSLRRRTPSNKEKTPDEEYAETLLREAAESGVEDLFVYEWAKQRYWNEAEKKDAMRTIGSLVAEGYEPALRYPFFFIEKYEDKTGYVAMLNKAAEKGDAECMESLIKIYVKGEMAAQDFAKSNAWIERLLSAPGASTIGLSVLGTSNRYSEVAAFLSWNLAKAENGDPLSQIIMGLSLEDTILVNEKRVPNPEVCEWFLRAAESGNAAAFRLMGRLFLGKKFGAAIFEPQLADRVERCLERYSAREEGEDTFNRCLRISGELGDFEAKSLYIFFNIKVYGNKTVADIRAEQWLREIMASGDWTKIEQSAPWYYLVSINEVYNISAWRKRSAIYYSHDLFSQWLKGEDVRFQ